ncbi:hypothetical protein LINPERPRIM_LOCUS3291 [Linum perenne]
MLRYLRVFLPMEFRLP